jgi:hypothetical protein
MANEYSVFEMRSPRSRDMPIRVVPFVAKQQLSTLGTSAAFNPKTTMVTIHSTLAGTVEFSTATADPAGAGITFPIAVNTYYDFDVQPGHKVRFV